MGFCAGALAGQQNERSTALTIEWAHSSERLCCALQELAMAYSLSLAGAYLIMATDKLPAVPGLPL